jgi:hypothetical protein
LLSVSINSDYYYYYYYYHGSTALCWALVPFSVLNPVRSRLEFLTSDQPFVRPLPTQTQSKHTFMPRVGFEPMTPLFERAKTGHYFDWTATVTV